ncbi:MAG: competence/damage-inducible protein cinA [candidate division NC10 bacterium]|nr:competence/damage-inducible protein cinA [candidate division NC10 bacterium]
MKAEIVAVGTELLLGQIVDTNSAYMAQQLSTIGVDVHFKSNVGDNLERIKATLRNALSRADFVLTTGGIGPTLDDLTREAVAEVAARPLVINQRLCDQIADFFTRVGRPMGENNRKQAFIPEEAIPIENPVGTAPGFIVECGTQAIASIPGVPHEMRHFMEHAILPYLRQKMGIREIIVSRVLKLFGIGESLVDEKIKDLIEEGKNPTIGLLAHTQIGEVHVRLTAKAEHAPDAQAMNSALECRVRERLEPFIFGSDDETYEGVLTRLLHDSGLTLAVAETGYGSSIIQTLKGLAGSDRFLKLGVTLTAPAMGAALPGVRPGAWGTRQYSERQQPVVLPRECALSRARTSAWPSPAAPPGKNPRTTSCRSPWPTPKASKPWSSAGRTPCASSRIAPQSWPWPRFANTSWSVKRGSRSFGSSPRQAVNELRRQDPNRRACLYRDQALLLVWRRSTSEPSATGPAGGAVVAQDRWETGRERNRAT